MVDPTGWAGYPPHPMRVPLLQWVVPMLLLAQGRPAEAQAPELAAASEAPTADIKQRLDEAVRAYQVGQREEARRLLVELVLTPPPGDPALLLEARIYLGELLYTEGDEEGARRFFEQVLKIDPSYIIDPFRHPPDVTSYFDYVRLYDAQTQTALKSLPPPIPALLPAAPISAWAPLGTYQLRHGRPGMGALWLGGGLAMVGVNAISFASLYGDRHYLLGDADEERRLRTLKALSLGSTIGFYAVWTGGVADAHRHWRRFGASEAAARATPKPAPDPP